MKKVSKYFARGYNPSEVCGVKTYAEKVLTWLVFFESVLRFVKTSLFFKTLSISLRKP